jgi:hypothetical protein
MIWLNLFDDDSGTTSNARQSSRSGNEPFVSDLASRYRRRENRNGGDEYWKQRLRVLPPINETNSIFGPSGHSTSGLFSDSQNGSEWMIQNR